MSKKIYVPYFAINPYNGDVPAKAMDAAQRELERRLGCAHQVLQAKSAFEAAGGLHAFWRGDAAPAITTWMKAIHAAALAAYAVRRPAQRTIDEIEQLNEAYLDVIAATAYGYTQEQWLQVFTAHFGMSDYCDSQTDALTVGRHWLRIAPEACPIAAADQAIRDTCQHKRALELPHTPQRVSPAQHTGALPAPVH